ncbi:MAG: polyprenyl diphosphate synthase [Alphaproteobacteria bacterium]|nr:polyprenyl diphosphate synthase [Alphaproteobacteria bacterium]
MKLNHLAIIMDGNRRWARMRTLQAVAGHDKGAQTLEDIASALASYDVSYLTVFAFSTENWRRSRLEVNALLDIMRRFLRTKIDRLIEDNVRLHILGDRTAFDADLQAMFADAEARTAHCTGLNLSVALNYGGQQDIEQAARRMSADAFASGGKTQPFVSYLETAYLPPVDMLIRTGGEQRLSNFLLWDLSYAELYFTETFWPDFDADELGKAINSFYSRQRRFGGDSTGHISDKNDASEEKLA